MSTPSGPTVDPVWGGRIATVASLGSRALLVRVPANLAQNARRQLLSRPLPGQREVTTGAASITVRFDTAGAARAARARLRALRPVPDEETSSVTVTIDTVYDGADLEDVAGLTGLGVDGLVKAHTGQEWRVAFIGFAPGFSYLRGQNPAFQVPRRSSPRIEVPAGAVAMAGPFSAVYPRASPGGWQLIGHTAARLWSLDEQPPTRLEPGTRVRFRAIRERIELPEPQRARLSSSSASAGAGGLAVCAPGAQSLVEDLGREGLSAWGVSRSGAADIGSLRQANRLVGNDPGRAVVENAAGGLRLAAIGGQVLAVTGADVPLTVRSPDGDREVAAGAPFVVLSGEVLELGTPRTGLRSYVAVRGGIDAPVVLGSRSTDTLAGLGVPALATGDFLPTGRAPLDAVGVPEPLRPTASTEGTVLDLVLGPDDDWFTAEARAEFLAGEWTVTPRSNRVGIRLSGSPVRRRAGELDSQGLAPGAIQIPPSGQPVLFLADHPATGGYPVIAVVADHHLDRAAQLPLGARIRFRIDT